LDRNHAFNRFLTFSQILRTHAQKSPDNTWLCDGITNKAYSFKEFDNLIDKGVAYLLRLGCKPKDIISAVINNRIEYLILYFSSIRLGTIFNPFPFSLSPYDVIKYINYTEPKILFCQKKHYNDLKVHWNNIDLIIDETEGGDFLNSLLNLNAESFEDFIPAHNEAACIYYSSGTTGNPKGIVFSHKNMMANISSIVRSFHWNNQDCHLVFLPLGHTASINYSILPMMYGGGKIVLFESFWKLRNNLWKHIEDYDVTYMQVVPSILFSILNTPYKDYRREKIKHFKYIGCGSSFLPLEIQKKIDEKFHIKVANLYGLSETGPTHLDDPFEADWEPGSIGRPLDINDVKIFDEDGNELKTGEIGEIAIRGDNVFINYYKNEKEYRNVFKNGYFCTGDLGFKDSKGKYYFADRKKDLIIKGGVNIFPGEIDEVIFSHPSVKEVLTVGLPDDYLGERIRSYIVLKDEATLNENEIKKFCLERLGEFKCPNEFVFVDEIPKGPSGKLLRKK
jgi:acyl-CoA synthetase (AMP-forming)/AMP-acid ligase II